MGSKVVGNLKRVDEARARVSQATSEAKKSALGQYMTPAPIAEFMASLFPKVEAGEVQLLDAGAGIGSLTSAFLDRILESRAATATVTAYEIDSDIFAELQSTLALYETTGRVKSEIEQSDFLRSAIFYYCEGRAKKYTHAILNPPYKKIATSSNSRFFLRKAGIETVNLYTGFLAVALLLLRPGGLLCAITPRSFCNGPYYRPFREFMFQRSSLRRIHLFESRKKAFAEDDVLQENIITLWERGGTQKQVDVSTSSDSSFHDFKLHSVEFDRIVLPNDNERMLHVVTESDSDGHLPSKFSSTLGSLGVTASTGPVVDFRMSTQLRKDPEAGAVPLIYPGHFDNGRVAWPKASFKKPNAIMRNEDTERWLFPRGNYALVRRFSSKEEPRRVVASFLAQDDLLFDVIGLENHVNVLHWEKKGLPRSLAIGLTAYLNSGMVDSHVRTFNGHTQVNATDLRSLPYPSLEILTQLGEWADSQSKPVAREIDAKLLELSHE
jgi:tRNA1(Val) A37 N6-methylase TrmN6